eukprot:TRINITY_DN2657_c0_g3_i1.p1 TRINITY_DN2657_c0_g3~~TRINITY_DN2657_c0_g3_i1.p1  ORF type:complete len:674 (+),score=151.68 TRINITY_DN2657_c0_g3_i1:75-2096(+)
MSSSGDEDERKTDGQPQPEQPTRRYSRDFMLKFNTVREPPLSFKTIDQVIQETNIRRIYDKEYLLSQRQLNMAPIHMDFVPTVRSPNPGSNSIQSPSHQTQSIQPFSTPNTDTPFQGGNRNRRDHRGSGQTPRSPASGTKSLQRGRQGRSSSRLDFNSTNSTPMSLTVSENAWVRRSAAGETETEIRKLMGLLNKLSRSNFQKLTAQMISAIKTPEILQGFVTTIFNKAIMEPGFSNMYSELCRILSDTIGSQFGEECTFKIALLTNCYNEVVNESEDEADEASLPEDEREYKRILKKKRKLGNMVFIGDLFKNEMFEEFVMHEIVSVYLEDVERHEDEMDFEGLCKLLTTIGPKLDNKDRNRKRLEIVNSYYTRLEKLIEREHLAARIRFMMKDLLELRSVHGWVPRSQSTVKKDTKGAKPSQPTVVISLNPARVSDGAAQQRIAETTSTDASVGKQGAAPAPVTVEDPAEEPVRDLMSAEQFENLTTLLFDEFLCFKDLADAIAWYKDLRYDNLGSAFVEKAVNYFLEKKEAQRAIITSLIAGLISKDMLTQADVEQGLTFHLSILDDLVIDIPQVGASLAKTVSELAVQNALSLSFLTCALEISIENETALPFVLKVLAEICDAQGPDVTSRLVSESSLDLKAFVPAAGSPSEFVQSQIASQAPSLAFLV